MSGRVNRAVLESRKKPVQIGAVTEREALSAANYEGMGVVVLDKESSFSSLDNWSK